MEKHICDECNKIFTSKEKCEDVDADVVEQQTCDIVEGQYIEWAQIRCPQCDNVVMEYGR